MSCNRLVIKSNNTIALGDPTDPTYSGPEGDRRGLYDEEAGAYVNDAMVTLEDLVHLESGQTVTGLTPPEAMAYVAGSNGVYKLVLDSGVGDDLVAGDEYEAEIKAVTTGGDVRTFYLSAFAERG